MVKNDLGKLEDIIEKASNILILSHIRPDPDAISSTLLLNLLLQNKFKDKKITSNIEGSIIEKYNFLTKIDLIQNRNSLEILNELKPDLLIIVDVANANRVTVSDQEGINAYINSNKLPLAIVDHHSESDAQECDIYINYKSSSVVETLYKVFVEQLGFPTFSGMPNIVMTGLISDTGGFKFKMENPVETMRVGGLMMEMGAETEFIQSTLSRLNQKQMKVFTELSKNFVCGIEYNYSYLSTNFLDSILKEISQGELYDAYQYFMFDRLRTTGTANWGFIIFRDSDKELENGNFRYKGSLRAERGIDVSMLAKKMNGGGNGHKRAAGFEVLVKNDAEALEHVLKIIEENKKEAYEE